MDTSSNTVTKTSKLDGPTQSLIDLTYLNEFTEGDANFIRAMIDLFMQNLPSSLEIILNANGTDDMKTLKAEVHKLKSSISLVGIASASKSIEIIENEIRTNPFGEMRRKEVEIFNQICLKAYTELEVMYSSCEK